MTGTKNRNNWDRLVSVASWIIFASLVYGSLYLWFIPPPAGGPVVQLVGVLGATLFYFFLYGIEAVVLAYAKLKGNARLRQRTLLTIYFTGVFTTILTVVLAGITPRMIDNVVFALLSGGCWLYWKLREEYLTREQICKEA